MKLSEHTTETAGDRRRKQKVQTLLRRIRWLQKREDDDGPKGFREREMAALTWALTESGAICGVLIEHRQFAADHRCLRPPMHEWPCDWQIEWGSQPPEPAREVEAS